MISNENRPITADDYIKLFKKYHQNILKFRGQDHVIVVTHFPPHLACLDPYCCTHPVASALNPYFIAKYQINHYSNL